MCQETAPEKLLALLTVTPIYPSHCRLLPRQLLISIHIKKCHPSNVYTLQIPNTLSLEVNTAFAVAQGEKVFCGYGNINMGSEMIEMHELSIVLMFSFHTLSFTKHTVRMPHFSESQNFWCSLVTLIYGSLQSHVRSSTLSHSHTLL